MGLHNPTLTREVEENLQDETDINAIANRVESGLGYFSRNFDSPCKAGFESV